MSCFACDPRVTEAYLRGLPQVCDAHVWESHGELFARVTLLATADTTGGRLRVQCACELGLQYTPRRVDCTVLVPLAAAA